MGEELITLRGSKALVSPEERRKMVLDRVKALKQQGSVYTPFEGGVAYVKFNGNTGEISYGRDNNPLPAGQRFVLALEQVEHGVVEWQSQQVLQRLKSKYLDGPAPSMPQGGVRQGTLPKPRHRDGWLDVISVRLVGIGGELDRVELEFESKNEGTQQAIQQVVAEMTEMCSTEAGQEGFFNAVAEVSVGSYWSKANSKDVYFPKFEIVGWTDGYSIRELSGAARLAATDGGSDGLLDR